MSQNPENLFGGNRVKNCQHAKAFRVVKHENIPAVFRSPRVLMFPGAGPGICRLAAVAIDRLGRDPLAAHRTSAHVQRVRAATHAVVRRWLERRRAAAWGSQDAAPPFTASRITVTRKRGE